MPVPRPRGTDQRVDVVIAGGKDLDGDGDSDHFDRILASVYTSSPAITPFPTLTGEARKAEAKATDASKSSDDGLSAIRVTATFPQAQATGTATPEQTVVVTLPPPPPPKHHDGDGGGGISQTTEHLLIAAGSIGATIIVVMIIFAIHTMKKRGLTLAEAVKAGRYQVTRRGPPPPPKRSVYNDDKASEDYVSMRNNSVTPPQPALARSGSYSSQRPLMLQRGDSFNRQNISDRSQSPDQSFLLDSPPRRNNSTRNNTSSPTPSSPVLPLQTARQSDSTHNTRSTRDEESGLQFPQPPQERALSPLPPPPTFRQFLSNRRSISQRGPGWNAMISRFSWTNSNAPQTPHDPARDTMINRDSFMTQRSSVPRFRTVDSWVNQQTNRIEEQKLKDQFGGDKSRFTQSTTYSDDEDTVPDVPDLPNNVAALREEGAAQDQIMAQQAPPTPPPSNGLPGKNVKHERHETTGTVETAPIFRQHPGTEVRISARSLVPSEILNGKMKRDVLS